MLLVDEPSPDLIARRGVVIHVDQICVNVREARLRDWEQSDGNVDAPDRDVSCGARSCRQVLFQYIEVARGQAGETREHTIALGGWRFERALRSSSLSCWVVLIQAVIEQLVFDDWPANSTTERVLVVAGR